MWTRFMDMHSGGRIKLEPYEVIYIEAPEEEAKIIFRNKYDRDPKHVTCSCCGPDYSLSEEESLEEISAYDRGDWEFSYKPKVSMEEYFTRDNVLVIHSKLIFPEDREDRRPKGKWVWMEDND